MNSLSWLAACAALSISASGESHAAIPILADQFDQSTKLKLLREALLGDPSTSSVSGTTVQPLRLAQWANWPNWNNWHNWANWGNY
jgi:hypothetical protein